MLAKGDRLYIPDKTAGPGEKVQSGSTLKVRVKKSLPKLRIVVRGFDGKPLADTDCILTVEGASVTVHTKSDGLLELDMPAHAADATLEANGQQWALKIGHLDPVDTDAGLWARLRNLGYLVDEVSADAEPAPDAPPAADALAFRGRALSARREAGDRRQRHRVGARQAAADAWLLTPARSTRRAARCPCSSRPRSTASSTPSPSPTCRSPAGASKPRASTSTRRSSAPMPRPSSPCFASLFDKTGSAALSVFGHADPVGDDEYNKALSGRRTKAVYGLLVRDTAMWSTLASSESWPQAALTMMQTRTGKPAGTARDELFRAYMDAICHRADGSPFIVDKAGFLGRGLDAGGKGDYQGCSEFNPILRFSSDDEQALSAPSRKTERDARNAPNRRVLVFMFPAGMFVPAAAWPCPRADEGTSGCRAQFWPDGDTRRGPQANERSYEHDKNTFACAFYDRMARRSPCEILRKTLRIRLLDLDGHPLGGAKYRLEIGEADVRTGTASGAAGDSKDERRRRGSPSRTCWRRASARSPTRRPTSTARPRHFPIARSSSCRATTRTTPSFLRRLHNLGFDSGNSAGGSSSDGGGGDEQRTADISAFQRDYGITVSGQLDEATKERLRSGHDDGVPPEQKGNVSG